MDVTRILDEDPKGRWYTLDGKTVSNEIAEETRAVVVLIRPLKPREILEIRRSATSRKFGGRRHSEEISDKKLQDLLVCRCVLSWKNIESRGLPLPVSDGNKIALNDHWKAFSDLWNRVFVEGEAEEEELEADDLGN